MQRVQEELEDIDHLDNLSEYREHSRCIPRILMLHYPRTGRGILMKIRFRIIIIPRRDRPRGGILRRGDRLDGMHEME